MLGYQAYLFFVTYFGVTHLVNPEIVLEIYFQDLCIWGPEVWSFSSRLDLFCHMLQALLGLGNPAASAHSNGTAKHRMMLSLDRSFLRFQGLQARILVL